MVELIYRRYNLKEGLESDNISAYFPNFEAALRIFAIWNQTGPTPIICGLEYDAAINLKLPHYVYQIVDVIERNYLTDTSLWHSDVEHYRSLWDHASNRWRY